MTLEEINQQLQQTDTAIKSLVSHPTPPAAVSSWWTVTNSMTISAVVLVFGLLVILLATYLIKNGKNAEAVLRIYGTILIVVASVFLVVAGYTDTQIAPVMGLLGTIVGYLLGKEVKST